MRILFSQVFLLFLISLTNLSYCQVIIDSDSGQLHQNSDGPTGPDNYGGDISNCSSISFSFDYSFSDMWIGAGNMETPDECNFGIPCAGDLNDSTADDCFNCWDYLWARFFIDGNMIWEEVIGDIGTTDSEQSGTLELGNYYCLDNNSNATLSMITQTWAAEESVEFTNIMIVCYELEPEIVANPEELCIGEDLELEEIGTGATDWEWAGNAGTESGSTWDINNISETEGGTYVVTVTDDGGCTATDEIDILVYPEVIAELVSIGSSDLCQGGCEILYIEVSEGGDYTADFNFGAAGSDFENFTGPSLAINVCLTGSGSNPIYDVGSQTIEIPQSLIGSSFDIELAMVENDDTGCFATLANKTFTYDLESGLTAAEPPSISLCAEMNNMATFDLTIRDLEVLDGILGDVLWFDDMAASIRITNPSSYLSNNTTVYAQIDDGNCFSQVVPLDLVVTNIVGGNISLTPLDGLIVCDNDSNPDTVFIELVVPSPSLDYSIDVIYELDGFSNQVAVNVLTGQNIIVFPDVLDSLKLEISNVTIAGGCTFVGTTDDVRVDIVDAPDVIPISPVTFCDFYILPAITVIGGTGGQAYYSMSGGIGAKLIEGDTVFLSSTLYAYDGTPGCEDEEMVELISSTKTEINLHSDTSGCEFFTLPILTGSNLTTGVGFFTEEDGGGDRLNPGDTVYQSMILHPYDTTAICIDTSSVFNINIIPLPDLSNLNDFSVCQFWEIDSLGLEVDSIVIYDLVTLDTLILGDTLFLDTSLGIIAGNNNCFNYDSLLLSVTNIVSAGIGLADSLCISNQDSVDLFNFLNGSFTPGGSWVEMGNSGLMIEESGKVEIMNLAAGIHTYKYSVSEVGCSMDSTFVDITLFAAANAGRDTSVLTCSDLIDVGSFFGNSDPGGSFLYQRMPAIDFSNPNSVDISGLSPDTHEFLYIVDHVICDPDTAALLVEILEVPHAGTGNSVTTCSGIQDSISLIGLIMDNPDSNGFWESITDPAVLVSQSGQVGVAGLISGQYTFNYIVESQQCGSDTAAVTFDLVSSPYAGRDTTSVICGGVIDLFAYFDGANIGGDFSIDPVVSIDFTDPSNVDLSQLPSGNYDINYTIGASGCMSDNALLQVDIVEAPSAGRDTVLLRCGDPMVIFSDLIREGDNNGVVEYDNQSVPASMMVNLETVNTSQFLYIVEGNNTCTSDTAIFTIEYDILLNAGMDVEFTDCEGLEIKLEDVLMNADLGGVFLDEAGDLISDTRLIINPGETVRYKYVTETLCNSDSADITITNYQFASFVSNASNTILCEEECFEFTIDLTGNIDYEVFYSITDLSGNNLDTSIVLDGVSTYKSEICISELSSFNTTNFLPDESYIIMVDSIVAEGLCTMLNQSEEIIVSGFGNRFGVLDTILCQGDSVTIGGVVFNENNTNDVITLSGAAETGCDSILSVSVVMENVVFGNEDFSLCRGETIMINGTEYSESLLSGQDTLAGASQNGCDSIVAVNISLLEPIIIFVERSFCGQDSSITVAEEVFDINRPMGNITFLGSASNGCDSIISVMLEFTPNSESIIEMSSCDDNFQLVVNNNVYDINNSSGTEVISGGAISGCDSIVSVDINFNGLSVQMDVDENFCIGDSAFSIFISESNGILPLEYTIGGISDVIQSIPAEIVLGVESGSELSILDAEGCTFDTIISIPLVIEENFDIEIIDGGGGIYMLGIISDVEIEEIFWSPTTSLSCTDCSSPTASPLNDITYLVEVITGNGCMLKDSITLLAADRISLEAPNIFSPNDDGVNDFWYLTSIGNFNVNVNSVMIYDRWGSLIFHRENYNITDPNQGWDGSFNNKKLNAGVYVYSVIYEDEAGNQQHISGDLTLIR